MVSVNMSIVTVTSTQDDADDPGVHTGCEEIKDFMFHNYASTQVFTHLQPSMFLKLPRPSPTNSANDIVPVHIM